VSIRHLFYCLMLPVLAACSTAPVKPAHIARGDYAYTKQYISWLIEKEMSSNDIVGLSIALVDDQKVVWKRGFGYADKQANIPASPETVYNLGSIAKVFTATAAMQLAEQGKMDINQPLKKYLPEFSVRTRFPDAPPVTPHNIMTQHSGLPSNLVHGMSARNPEPFMNVVQESRGEYMAFPPDYVFAYSNLGFTLLGAAIARVSGEDYPAYMDEHILKPLEMDHSAFVARIPGKAYRNGREVEAFPLRDLPSGGLNSSVDDISHFMEMVFAGGTYKGRRILKPDTLAEMMRPQNANIPLDFDFRMGLGWMLSGVDVARAGTVASHGGTTLNYHTLMAVLPEHKLGVVVMSNSAEAHNAVGKIAVETLKLALEAKTGIAQPAKLPPDDHIVPLTDADRRAYEGYFDTLIGVVKVDNDDGDLVAEVMGHKFELLSHGDGQFGIRFKLFGFIPVKVSAFDEVNLSLPHVEGRDALVLKSNGQSMLVGDKLKTNPIPAGMRDFVGDYEILNKVDGPLPDRIWIREENGILLGEFTFPGMPGFVFSIALNPVSNTEAVIAGLGSGKGDTLTMKKIGGEEHIFYSGFELKKKPATGERS
jgi:CubicO group peptidase (beta-lactamase class C family)